MRYSFLTPVSKSGCDECGHAVPLDALVVDQEVSHLADKEVSRAAHARHSQVGGKASDEQVTTNRVSQRAAVVLGQVLVLDAERQSVAIDLHVALDPRVVG